MRALVLTKTINPTIGGWGRYADELIMALDEAGVESVVACHEPFTKRTVLQYTLLPSSLSFKKLYFFGWVYALRVWMCRKSIGRFNLIHCMAEPYAPVTWFLSRMWGVPYIVTIHGSRGVLQLGHRVYGPIQKYVYRHAAAVICVSDYTKRQVLRYIDLNNLHVIANGVSEDMFSQPRAEKQSMLLGVGGLKQRKGYHHVVRALPLVQAAVPDVRYTIVGDQNDRGYTKKLKELVSELGLNDVVTFKTNISDEELTTLYEQAQAFVLTPESTDFGFEGFGLVFLEANAHGVPVIGAYGSGTEEAIADGRSGFLVDLEKEGMLAEKIVKVLTMEKNTYGQYVHQAQEWAREHLWSHQALRYIDVYNSVTV